MTLHDKLIRN